MSKLVGGLVQFRATPGMREWLKNAAHHERTTLSAWLRDLALQRATELVPPPASRLAEVLPVRGAVSRPVARLSVDGVGK